MILDSDLGRNYEIVTKKIKLFAIIGQLVILIIRVLVQRLFSLYIGIVVLQIIISTLIYLRSRANVEAKFYILMNFILIYLLTINFIEVSNNKEHIQHILKDRYVINYIKIGYPLEFSFRVISTLIMWRIYQLSILKIQEFENSILTEDSQGSQINQGRIHVRQNLRDEHFEWNLTLAENNSQNRENSLNQNLPSSNLNRNHHHGINLHRLNPLINQNVSTLIQSDQTTSINQRNPINNILRQNHLFPNFNNSYTRAEVNSQDTSSNPQPVTREALRFQYLNTNNQINFLQSVRPRITFNQGRH